MKLAIFGGTGRTGLQLVSQALEQGHQVTVLARNPEKLTIKNVGLSVIQGNVKDQAAVEKTIAGADAVLSVMGPTSNKPLMEVSQGITNIIATMKKQGCKRLIVTSGAGVSDPKDEPKLINHVISMALKLTAKNVLLDMQKVVDIVRDSNLEWTVVRLPMLTDDPKPAKILVGYVGKGMGSRIARRDVAEFILKQVENRTYLRTSPAISN